MYMCMHVRICVICTHTCTHACMHTCIRIYTHTYIHTYHACIHAYRCTYTHARIHVMGSGVQSLTRSTTHLHANPHVCSRMHVFVYLSQPTSHATGRRKNVGFVEFSNAESATQVPLDILTHIHLHACTFTLPTPFPASPPHPTSTLTAGAITHTHAHTGAQRAEAQHQGWRHLRSGGGAQKRSFQRTRWWRLWRRYVCACCVLTCVHGLDLLQRHTYTRSPPCA